MALYKQADFAKTCGVTNAYLSVNIKRGKVFVNGGFIDDQEKYNADFLQKCLDKKKSNKPEKNAGQSEQSYKDNTNNEGDIGNESDGPLDNASRYSLDVRLKRQELEKKQAETRLLNLKEEKIRGEVMQVSLVIQLISAHNQSIITTNKDTLESLLINISKEARLSGDQLAGLRGKLVKILNESSEKAVAMTKRNLKSLVQEFTIKKEVGEHE